MTLAFFIEELGRDPVYYVSVVVAVVVSITLHELGHGVAAIWQGDDTPRHTGHMTLDPTVHMPPFSWALLLLAGISYGLMPVDPTRFRSRHGGALVAAAGPVVNLLLALLGLTVFALWRRSLGAEPEGTALNFLQFFYIFGILNMLLFLFNLLPVPPLDGSAVLADFSPAYERVVRNPDNQPFFLGAFVLVFAFSGRIFDGARTLAADFLRLWGA